MTRMLGSADIKIALEKAGKTKRKKKKCSTELLFGASYAISGGEAKNG